MSGNKKIELTQGQVAIVDEWNYEWLSQWKWYAHWDRKAQAYYAVRNEYKPFRRRVFMHREIMKTPKGVLCDHKNRNTLDNREHNLRNASHSQNAMNRKGTNALGQKNIYPYRTGFQIIIKKHGKNVFYATRKTLEEAIAVRDEALKVHHGEYAYKEAK